MQFNTIDRFNREKLYIQLTRVFLDEIHSKRWKLNQRIPSEDELCKHYNVSKITVRQAISNLVADGYLMKIQGKGTFVTSVLPVVGLAMKTRFTEEMFGKEVMAEKEIIYKGIKEPGPEIRGYLNTSDEIYQIVCRRLVNKQPAYLDESYIPYFMLPGIETLDIAAMSLYSFLQEHGVKKIFRVIQTIEVQAASEDLSRHLDLIEGVPVLVVHRLLLSSDNMPVGYTRFLGRSDRYKFQSDFERIR
ncbi:MAG: GntR family transcriptional regulator [Nitrospirae bacterium]|nr:GntR family transcriptional regulator [Nitrospirota bacterium]